MKDAHTQPCRIERAMGEVDLDFNPDSGLGYDSSPVFCICKMGIGISDS